MLEFISKSIVSNRKNLSGRMVTFLDIQLEKNKFPLEKIEDAQKAILQIYLMIK